MKIPEEIKKGLEKCPNADCSLCLSSFHCDLEADALAYIQQLERERDALLADLRGNCRFCAHENEQAATCAEVDFDCRDCETKCLCFECETANNWVWRGVREVE